MPRNERGKMEKNRGPKIFSGFFLGALVGGTAVFLFGTKRGRRILKSLTREGMEDVSDLKALLTEKIDDEVVPAIKKLEPKVEKKTQEVLTNAGMKPSTAKEVVSSAKKLFHKSSKK